MKKPMMIFSGVLSVLAGTYFGLTVSKITKDSKTREPSSISPSGFPITSKERSRSKFDELASEYDRIVEKEENWIGVSAFRRQLLQKARGDVLEVAAGTGRNQPYYRYASSLSSVTQIDQSSKMLAIAQQKALQLPSEKEEVSPVPHPPPSFFKFLEVDAHSLVPSFGEQAFDTVIDTFGLCSFEDPKTVLKEMARVCKPDGQILLLEHGQSSWPIVSQVINFTAPAHETKFACWYNRDIVGLVKEAGLEVTEVRKEHFGTTYIITAKPSPLPPMPTPTSPSLSPSPSPSS